MFVRRKKSTGVDKIPQPSTRRGVRSNSAFSPFSSVSLGLLVGASLLVGAAPFDSQGTAHGQPKDGKAKRPKKKKPDYKAAKRHYQAAEKAVQAKRWSEAAEEYLTAYDITQDPVLFFKIANAYQMNGNCPDAIVYFKRYNAEAKPSVEYQSDTKARIEKCKADTAIGTDTVAENSDTMSQSPMDSTEVEAEPPRDDIDYENQPSFVDEEVTWQKTAGWTSVGVSAAFLTAGAVLGLSAKSRQEDLENLISFRNSADQPTSFDQTVSGRYKALSDEGDTLNTMSLVAFGLAGASAATAIVFFLLDDSPEESEGLSHISPTIGNDSYGVSAGWSF